MAQGSRYKRLTINISPEVEKRLTELAEANDSTVTEVLRRGVTLLGFLHDNPGYKLTVPNDDGTQREIVFLG